MASDDRLKTRKSRTLPMTREEQEPVYHEGFDVTCTIGRVVFREMGDHTPSEAAFLLIARHNAPGTYRFPNEDGSTTVIHMGFEPEAESGPHPGNETH